MEEEKKIRESKSVQIVEYQSKQHRKDFKSLNEEWISKYFEMEGADHRALDNPEEYILKKGGKIFIALYNDNPVGVCALLKMNDPEYDFELAKMAVSPQAQGKNIGWLLAQSASRNSKNIRCIENISESNTILKPAINLYHKLGFKKITGRHAIQTL